MPTPASAAMVPIGTWRPSRRTAVTAAASTRSWLASASLRTRRRPPPPASASCSVATGQSCHRRGHRPHATSTPPIPYEGCPRRSRVAGNDGERWVPVKWPVDRDREFTEFVMARRAALVRVAALLVPGDLARAEDVVQTALTRLYVAWPRVRPDTVDAYARRCVVNAATDDHRSLFNRREQVRAELPDVTALESGSGDATSIVALLGALPAGMRAAVVLRYIEGLS